MNTKNKQYIKIDGLKFSREPNGYFRITTLIDGKRTHLLLHQYIYSKKHGEIPENHEIHHIDFNKDNNNIDNLTIMTYSNHRKLHNKSKKFIEWRKSINKNKEFINKVQSSLIEARKILVTKKCIFCRKIFNVPYMYSHKNFCSNTCYTKHRWITRKRDRVKN